MSDAPFKTVSVGCGLEGIPAKRQDIHALGFSEA